MDKDRRNDLIRLAMDIEELSDRLDLRDKFDPGASVECDFRLGGKQFTLTLMRKQ